MASCVCGIPNTGQESCPIPELPKKALYLVKLVDDSGVRNSYPIADLLDQAELDSRINEADPSKRWYPLTDLDNLAETVTLPSSSTGQFGAKRYANKKSVRDREVTFFERSQADADLWTSGFGCGQWGVYAVDMDKTVYGYWNEDNTLLYPGRIATGTFLATYYEPSVANSEPNKVVITYTLDISNNDAKATKMTGVTADILNAQGLRALEFTYSNITATGFKITVKQRSSNAASVLQTGLVQADFVLKNKVTDVTIVFTAFNETADGEYTVTHASQTTGVTAYTTFSRTTFDGGSLAEQTITYP